MKNLIIGQLACSSCWRWSPCADPPPNAMDRVPMVGGHVTVSDGMNSLGPMIEYEVFPQLHQLKCSDPLNKYVSPSWSRFSLHLSVDYMWGNPTLTGMHLAAGFVWMLCCSHIALSNFGKLVAITWLIIWQNPYVMWLCNFLLYCYISENGFQDV